MADEHRLNWSLTQSRIFLVAGLALSTGGAEAQQVLPGIDEGSVTYRTEPFRVDRDALLKGLEHPEILRKVIEEETGLGLPGSVQGLYFLGGDDKLDTCRVICVGEGGGPPCYSTCGSGILQ